MKGTHDLNKELSFWTSQGLVGSALVSSGPVVQALENLKTAAAEASDAVDERRIKNYIAGVDEMQGGVLEVMELLLSRPGVKKDRKARGAKARSPKERSPKKRTSKERSSKERGVKERRSGNSLVRRRATTVKKHQRRQRQLSSSSSSSGSGSGSSGSCSESGSDWSSTSGSSAFSGSSADISRRTILNQRILKQKEAAGKLLTKTV